MTSQNMIAEIENSASEEAGASEEDEPPRPWVDLAIEDERWDSVTELPRLIPPLVAEALTAAGLSPDTHSISVALMSDADVHALNRLFREKDSPTNVLSFPAVQLPAPAEPGALFLGDIALAYETVMREAEHDNKPPLNHAAHLIAHGVLHLAGFDHDRDEDADRMESAERAVLARFGIPDPYSDADPAAAKPHPS